MVYASYAAKSYLSKVPRPRPN